MPILAGNFAALLSAAADGDVRGHTIALQDGVSVGVVIAAGGYPGKVQTGATIAGLDAAAAVPGVSVFHSGTAARGGEIVTAGGRVLTVVGTGATYRAAIDRAYQAVELISFEGMQYRRDIGRKAL